MMALLYILGGLICLVIWPAFYVFRYHKETDHALKCNAMLFSPSVLLLSSYLLWFGQQQNVPSIACGMVQGYHTYMRAGTPINESHLSVLKYYLIGSSMLGIYG